jgi:two-component system cell cycle response regulator CpdR
MARILIAEDDSSMRQFLAMALRRAGHDVILCDDGISAYQAIQETETPYDLLLADIVMPGMDGIELSRKANALIPALKVMFITGFAGVVLAHKDSIVNQSQVLSKPFHLKDLVDQVERLLAA